MLTHSYKRKTGKQFLDFINRVDNKYGDNIRQIFLVLDNASIHKSKIVKETIARYHPRIYLVFLPTRTPELNLIEVRWLWLHRQAINNSTFESEQAIGKAVSEWTSDYNKKHAIKENTISL
jgi:transposase